MISGSISCEGEKLETLIFASSMNEKAQGAGVCLHVCMSACSPTKLGVSETKGQRTAIANHTLLYIYIYSIFSFFPANDSCAPNSGDV